MTVIRVEAMRALECAILSAVPELEGKICVGQSMPNHALGFPSLAIIPVRFRYIPDQAHEFHECSPSEVVMYVGRYEITIQLWLMHATMIQRAELEQKVLDVFLRTPLHPGVLLAQITSAPTWGQITCAFELQSNEWEDEKAFDNNFGSQILLNGIIPALTTRGSAHTMRQLLLGMDVSGDFTNEATPTTMGDVADILQIQEDGSLTPA